MTKAAATNTFQSKPPSPFHSSPFPISLPTISSSSLNFIPHYLPYSINSHIPSRRCGIDIGLFINVRKCSILYLHGRNGSWSHAPYLDKHGEVDPGLRRNRQLFLSQKRYDVLLRNVWLQHGVPTMISRKLEADMNNGGWETL